MTDQSTRARTPEADPRQPFTLSKTEAERLQELGAAAASRPGGVDDLNSYWAELGNTHGFVWTTVDDLGWTGPEAEPEPNVMRQVDGATFTAWPSAPAPVDHTDALAWLAGYDPQDGKGGAIGETDGTEEFTRDVVVAAFEAGRAHGFAMGSASPQPSRVVGWDAVELLRECAEYLRGVERTQREDAWRTDTSNGGKRATEDEARVLVDQAERNALHASRLEAFLADPYSGRLAHDGLREAREDAANGVVAGFTAAIAQVRELVESGRAQAGSAIPPLVLLSRLDELRAPEDMDEALGPWRGVGAALVELRKERALPTVVRIATNAENMAWALEVVRAYKEWTTKTLWVQEALQAGVFKNLGLPPQWGKHRADVLRVLVERLNTLLEPHLVAAQEDGAAHHRATVARHGGLDPDVVDALRQNHDGGETPAKEG